MLDRSRLGPPQRVTGDDDRPPLALPSRWPVVAAFLGLTLGGLVLPWATFPQGFLYTSGPWDLNGSRGSATGVPAFLLGLLLLGVAASRGAAESRTRTIQLAPAALGAIIALTVATGVRDALNAVASTLGNNSPAFLDPGLYVEALAGALALLGGVLTTLSIQRRSPTGAPAGQAVPRHGQRGLRALVTVAAIGAIGGVAVALAIVSLLSAPESQASLVVLGLLIGPPVALALWQRLASDPTSTHARDEGGET